MKKNEEPKEEQIPTVQEDESVDLSDYLVNTRAERHQTTFC